MRRSVKLKNGKEEKVLTSFENGCIRFGNAYGKLHYYYRLQDENMKITVIPDINKS